MRTLSTAGAAALSGAVVCVAILIEMDLTSQLCLNTSSLDITINGTTYLGAGGLGQIDSIKQAGTDLPQVRFTLAGVQSTSIALALLEPVQGAAVRIYMALFDSSTGALLDKRMRYSGYLDVMSISDGKDSATLSVSSESAMLDLLRPKCIYYSDIDQQTLYTGDLAFQYVNDQVEAKIAWPAASFFVRH